MQTAIPQLEIIVIPAKTPVDNPMMPKRQLRVAAYCRVSTDEEDQENSLINQKEFYTEKIMSNPDWTLAGIFPDEGISGTSTKKREKFLEMIKLCTKGKIDLIITKSISRFARNTVDCLQYARMLKSMNIPIIFEKENLDTSKIPNEMLLTILSWFAQAESESISQNVSWGIRRRMQKGIVVFNYKHFLGYKKSEDGQPEIIEREAEVIRRIFNRYLEGDSLVKIKNDLEKDGILTKTGKKEWSTGGIKFMLCNEKYSGDSLLQKTFVENVLTHKSKKNLGERPQYLIRNSHVAIIDRSLFHLVQEEMARRSSKRKVSDKTLTELSRYSSMYALTELLVCGNCGTPYKRVTWAQKGKKQGEKKIVWRCVSRLDYGKKYCKESPTIEESMLHNAILNAINTCYSDTGARELVSHCCRAEIGRVNDGIDTAAIEKRNEQLGQEITRLAQMTPIDYDRFKEISDEISANKEIIRKHNDAISANEAAKGRLDQISKAIETITTDLNEWNDSLVRNLIHTVKVLSADKVRVIFRAGIEVEQNLYRA